MKTPKYEFGDEVYFVEKGQLFFGPIIGLSYVEKADTVVYLVKVEDDVNPPRQTREEYMDVDRIALVDKLKEEALEYHKQELMRYDQLLKEEPNGSVVKKEDLAEQESTV